MVSRQDKQLMSDSPPKQRKKNHPHFATLPPQEILPIVGG
jgi:hypothetical protein